MGCSSGKLEDEKEVAFQSPNDAVITAIQTELGMEVMLKVENLRKNNQWAFLTGIPLSKTGERIDYNKTRFAADIREGYFDDGFVALTKKDIKSGNWTLIELSLGATDAPFIDWPEQYRVPKNLIFPEK